MARANQNVGTPKVPVPKPSKESPIEADIVRLKTVCARLEDAIESLREFRANLIGTVEDSPERSASVGFEEPILPRLAATVVHLGELVGRLETEISYIREIG